VRPVISGLPLERALQPPRIVTPTMSVYINVMSVSLLVQREDQPAVLTALQELARELSSQFHNPGAVLAATDLVAALDANYWCTEVDEHGDLVGLIWGIERYPAKAYEEWPDTVLKAFAPHARFGTFHVSIEGSREIEWHFFEDGAVRRRILKTGIEVVATGPVPPTPPGGAVTVEVTARTNGLFPFDESERIALSIEHDTQVSARLRTPETPPDAPSWQGVTVAPNGTAQLEVTVEPGAADPVVVYLGIPDEVVSFPVHIPILAPPEEADEVIETQAGFRASLIMPAERFGEALRQFRRYADRYQDRPGAEFLRSVAAAPDLVAAFAAAGIEATVDAEGLWAWRFTADRLPGYERYLAGLLWSLEGLLATSDCAVIVAYPHQPDRWVWIGFEWGNRSRNFTARDVP